MVAEPHFVINEPRAREQWAQTAFVKKNYTKHILENEHSKTITPFNKIIVIAIQLWFDKKMCIISTTIILKALVG